MSAAGAQRLVLIQSGTQDAVGDIRERRTSSQLSLVRKVVLIELLCLLLGLLVVDGVGTGCIAKVSA